MEIKLLPENKRIRKDFDGKAEDLVRSLNLRPDEVIVLKGKKPIPIDEYIGNEEEITLIRVSSGG